MKESSVEQQKMLRHVLFKKIIKNKQIIMSRIKYLAVAALFACGLTASAQSVQSTNPISSGWQSVWFNWNKSKVKSDYKEFNAIKFNQLSLGYSRAFSVSRDLPLYVEGGLGVQYSYDKETNMWNETKNIYHTEKYRVLSAVVPAHLLYRWDIPSSKLSLMPFVGLNFRFNIVGRNRREAALIGDGSIQDFDKKSYDLYDDANDKVVDPTTGETISQYNHQAWDRFQWGWDFGVKLQYDKRYTIGLSWGRDFNDFAKNSKIRTRAITLEYTF